MRPFRLASLLVLAGLFGAMALPGMATAAPAARKADKDLARAAFLRGTKHYNLNEYKEALDSFKDAYRAYEEPSFLFNIAQCQRQLGMRADAIRSYRAYLREGSNIRNREDVEQIIAGLERSVRDEETTRARPPQGTLGPDGAPPSARVAMLDRVGAALASGARTALDSETTRVLPTTPPV